MIHQASVTVHLLAAFVWVGGIFFLGLVGAPALRSLEPAPRAALFRSIGARFRAVGWAAIAILIATGLLNLHLRGALRLSVLGDGAFWASRFGLTLAWKLGLVAAMLAIQGAHDFVWGPASARATPGSPEALRLRRRAALSARVNAMLAVLVVIAAARLARGW